MITSKRRSQDAIGGADSTGEVDESGPDVNESATEVELPGADANGDEPATAADRRPVDWRRVLVYGVLPAVALVLAAAIGFFKWQYASVHDGQIAAAESLQVAKDSTVALLSYTPDTVDRDLTSARDRTTGSFRDAYTQLTNTVVIPGAKQQRIAAVATIPAAVSVSADANHAVALVFVSQKVTMGQGTPTDTISSVRVSLDKIDDRWLISGFDPV